MHLVQCITRFLMTFEKNLYSSCCSNAWTASFSLSLYLLSGSQWYTHVSSLVIIHKTAHHKHPSTVDCRLLCCNSMRSCTWLPTFWRNTVTTYKTIYRVSLWRNVPEHCSGSSFSEGRKPKQRSGTFLPGINKTNTSPSLTKFLVTMHSRTYFL
jgi:hypothetical protein